MRWEGVGGRTHISYFPVNFAVFPAVIFQTQTIFA